MFLLAKTLRIEQIFNAACDLKHHQAMKHCREKLCEINKELNKLSPGKVYDQRVTDLLKKCAEMDEDW